MQIWDLRGCGFHPASASNVKVIKTVMLCYIVVVSSFLQQYVCHSVYFECTYSNL